jgi:beta-barrel assembly-enhancing protease
VKLVSFLLISALLSAPAFGNELPELGDASQAALSPLQERRFGEAIMRQIRTSPAYLDDSEVADYLNAIGYRLVASGPEPGGHFEFFAIDDSSVNAFALPGGYIGVHTGLLLTAQSESELASVLGHEIAHVTQRHIARMIAAQQRSGLASMAALAVAILAARSNADLSQAAIVAAQAGSIQSALNFSREHEREADRIGLQIVEKSGFDAHAMPVFLERLQRSSRLYEGGAPSYLRTHPLTFERVADVQNRTQSIPFRQVPDSREFHLVRARLQAAQGAPREAVEHFDMRLRDKKYVNEAAMHYGRVVALMRANDLKQATEAMPDLQRLADDHPMVKALAADLLVRSGDLEQGLTLYEEALRAHPSRRALVFGYARALLDRGRPQQAVEFLSKQLERGPVEARHYELQARGYDALGQKLMRHRAQAEAYLLKGSLARAIEQLRLAQSSGDGDFFQQSSVEARLRELIALDADQRRRD